MILHAFSIAIVRRLFRVECGMNQRLRRLINGKGRWTDLSAGNTTTTPLEVFNVKKGYRYRFRMINSMTSACTLGMRVIGHNLTVITTDGELVRPQVVDAIHSSAGERYDFILHADQEAGEYWIQFWATGLCLDDQIQQLAILKYEGSDSTKPAVVPTYQEALNQTGLALNYPLTTCGHDTTHGLCLAHLRSGYEIDDKELLKEKPDVKLYLNYTLMSYAAEELFQNDSHRTYAVFGGTQYVQAFVNGYSFKFPPSPLLSQYQDAKHSICPTDGSNPPGCSGNCSCTNVFNVPLNSIVEIVMIDGVDLSDVHSFHLHGYTFKVVGMGTPADLNVTACNSANIREFDEAGKLKRNLIDPPGKDTVTVPDKGYAIFRFRADNPGFWLFHCHFDVHMHIGMAAVLQVGDWWDVPAVPYGFPRCGSYVPDINIALLQSAPKTE